MNLREDFNNKINNIVDAQERQNFSTSSKTKASIYLEAAEALAKEVWKHVSSSEYYVLGVENYLDSDFRQAREYYQKAVQASDRRDSSIISKSLARRTLAGSYFLQEPRNISEGRRYYGEALKVLEKREVTDFYSIYIQALISREWAAQEAWFGNEEEAYKRLSEAFSRMQELPDWYPLKQEEIRSIADGWRGLANSYFQTNQGIPIPNPNLKKAREAYIRSLDVTQVLILNDENTVDLRGQIHQDWAYNEILYGSRQEGEKHFNLAKQQYSNLSHGYPRREVKLKGLESASAMVKEKLIRQERIRGDNKDKPIAVQGQESSETSLGILSPSPSVPPPPSPSVPPPPSPSVPPRASPPEEV